MKHPGLILLLALSLPSPTAHVDCLDDVAAYHRVDGALLRSIALYESHANPPTTNRNRDGSQDLGFMQINSAYLPRLARYGITRQQLLDACINAYVGTWILYANIDRLGATWRVVGAYNATTPVKQLRYANQIYTRWQSPQCAALPRFPSDLTSSELCTHSIHSTE